MKLHMQVKKGVGLVILLVLSLALVGCQKTLTPKETAIKLFENRAMLEGYDMKFEGDLSIELGGEVDPSVEQYLGILKNIKLTGDMQYQKTDKIGDYAMHYTVDLNGMVMNMEMYFDGTQMIIKYPLLPNYIVVDLAELLEKASEEGGLPFTLDYDAIVADLTTVMNELMPKLNVEMMKLINEESLEIIDAYTFTVDGESVTSKALKIDFNAELFEGMMNSFIDIAKDSKVLYDVLKKYDVENELGTFEAYQSNFEVMKETLENEVDMTEFYKILEALEYTYILGYDKSYKVKHMATKMVIRIDEATFGTDATMTMNSVYAMDESKSEVVFPEITEENSMFLEDFMPDLEGAYDYESTEETEESVSDLPVNDQVEVQTERLLALTEQIEGAQTDEEINQMLEAFLLAHESEIMYAYFATEEGVMHLYPREALPEDYDPRTRPFYMDTIVQGFVVHELYVDANSGMYVQTISKTIEVDGVISGVVGIDFYVE